MHAWHAQIESFTAKTQANKKTLLIAEFLFMLIKISSLFLFLLQKKFPAGFFLLKTLDMLSDRKKTGFAAIF